MAKMQFGQSLVYVADPEKSCDENLDAICKHMKSVLEMHKEFSVTLNIPETKAQDTLSYLEFRQDVMNGVNELLGVGDNSEDSDN